MNDEQQKGSVRHSSFSVPPFDYVLPPHLIAQVPCPQRDQARLLVVNRAAGSLAHHVFLDLADLLQPGDLLVLNDTRVVRARLLGRRQTGGKWEGLFLRLLPDGTWEILGQSRGRLRSGEAISIDPGPLELRLLDRLPGGRWQVRPNLPGEPEKLLEQFGHVPLPPYIRKGAEAPEDRERYQTVFARQSGAVAAPTAGLHFTPRVFDRLRQGGIDWTFITLHVGPGTFQPIQVEDVRQHPMHHEWCALPETAVSAISACRKRGCRVVAVGTTSVRVLETVAGTGPLRPWQGETDLFIYPPYEFKAVDALVTNFHLPRTTLLLLAAAFAGVDLLRQAYKTAMDREYRFYSYGDAMLIL